MDMEKQPFTWKHKTFVLLVRAIRSCVHVLARCEMLQRLCVANTLLLFLHLELTIRRRQRTYFIVPLECRFRTGFTMILLRERRSTANSARIMATPTLQAGTKSIQK